MADYRSARSTHILTSHLAGGSSHGTRLLAAKNSDSLAQNVPLLYDADGNVISTATRTGNTTNYATAIVGSKTSGFYPKWDSNGNLTDGDTGGGGGAPTNYPDNVPFVDSGFSWTNQTTGTGTSTDGDIFIISRTNVLANDFSLYLQAVPSTPYKLWTRFLFRGRLTGTQELGGICWYDSGGGAWMFYGMRGNNTMILYGATKVTPTPTFTQYYESTMPFYAGQSGAFSFGLEDDGSNKDAVLCPTLQYSRLFRRFTHSEYITPTHIGLWISDGVASGESYLEVLSYDYY